jgi:hypothetical protein
MSIVYSRRPLVSEGLGLPRNEALNELVCGKRVSAVWEEISYIGRVEEVGQDMDNGIWEGGD